MSCETVLPLFFAVRTLSVSFCLRSALRTRAFLTARACVYLECISTTCVRVSLAARVHIGQAMYVRVMVLSYVMAYSALSSGLISYHHSDRAACAA